MVLAALLLVGLGWDGQIGAVDGVLLLAVLVAFTAVVLRRVQQTQSGISAAERAEMPEARVRDAAAVVGGIVALVVGSSWLVDGGSRCCRPPASPTSSSGSRCWRWGPRCRNWPPASSSRQSAVRRSSAWATSSARTSTTSSRSSASSRWSRRSAWPQRARLRVPRATRLYRSAGRADVPRRPHLAS